MTLPVNEKVLLHEYRESGFVEVSLPFSAEYAVTLSINGSPYITMACSGSYLKEHMAGYLITEGIINDPDQIEKIDIDEAHLTVNVYLAEDRIITEIYACPETDEAYLGDQVHSTKAEALEAMNRLNRQAA